MNRDHQSMPTIRHESELAGSPLDFGFYEIFGRLAYLFRHDYCTDQPGADVRMIPAWLVGESPVAHNDRYHGIIVHQLAPTFLAHWAIGEHADRRFYRHPYSSVRISDPLPIGRLATAALQDAKLRSDWMEEAVAAVDCHRDEIKLFWPEPDMMPIYNGSDPATAIHATGALPPLPEGGRFTRVAEPTRNEAP